MALDIMPTSFWRRHFEQALVGQAQSAENIESVSQAVVDDLGDQVLGDIFSSADYRRAVAPIDIQRAVSLAAERT